MAVNIARTNRMSQRRRRSPDVPTGLRPLMHRPTETPSQLTTDSQPGFSLASDDFPPLPSMKRCFPSNCIPSTARLSSSPWHNSRNVNSSPDSNDSPCSSSPKTDSFSETSSIPETDRLSEVNGTPVTDASHETNDCPDSSFPYSSFPEANNQKDLQSQHSQAFFDISPTNQNCGAGEQRCWSYVDPNEDGIEVEIDACFLGTENGQVQLQNHMRDFKLPLTWMSERDVKWIERQSEGLYAIGVAHLPRRASVFGTAAEL